jgi:hypothetical protein
VPSRRTRRVQPRASNVRERVEVGGSAKVTGSCRTGVESGRADDHGGEPISSGRGVQAGTKFQGPVCRKLGTRWRSPYVRGRCRHEMMNRPAPEFAPELTAVAPLALKIGRARWQVRSAAVAQLISGWLNDPDALLANKAALTHDTLPVTMARTAWPTAPSRHALLRRNNYAKPSTRWRDVFRTAGPLRAFHTALALERAGIPTPRVLAAGVVRQLRLPRAGYLLVEEIAPATTLAKLAQQPAGIPRLTIRRVAEEIARMHERGFLHGDLTINNVLLDGQGQPWFIDLERARIIGHPANWRQAVDDFHRIARHVWKFSPGARRSALRLMITYCAARGWAGRERRFSDAIFQRVKHKMEADRAA